MDRREIRSDDQMTHNFSHVVVLGLGVVLVVAVVLLHRKINKFKYQKQLINCIFLNFFDEIQHFHRYYFLTVLQRTIKNVTLLSKYQN